MTGAIATLGAGGVLSFAGFQSQTLTGVAPASYTMEGSGRQTANGGIDLGRWIDNGSPSNYEKRATVTSGSLTSGTTGSWLAGDMDHTWQKNSGAPVTFTLELRDKFTLVVVKTVSIVLEP